MFQFKGIFVILLLTISRLAAAGTAHYSRHDGGAVLKHRSNAARMADGLPPLPPRQVIKARTNTPTQPNQPQPSSSKPDCDDKKEIHIKCNRKNGGQSIGYVSKNFSSKGKDGFGLTSNSNNALKCDFENSVTPFDFKISASTGAYPYLGFCGNNLKTGASDSAILTSTKKTNQGSGPANVGNSHSSWSANSESQVWAYARSTKSITSSWINSGGSAVASPKVFYNPDDDNFHLTGDSAQLTKKYTNAYEVVFSLED